MEQSLLPPLVVRAGLTGHRPNRLNIPLTHLCTQVDAVLGCMERAVLRVASEQAGLYRAQPAALRFTTGLARGSDEAGAQVALHRQWQLQSVIAFDRQTFADLAVSDCTAQQAMDFRQRYETLLERSSSVLEVGGKEHGGLRRDGYELVGEVILKQSDVLIGVWDGEPARGLGGTAQIMRMALQRGLPVVWIHASDREQPLTVYLPARQGTHDLEALGQWLFGSLMLGPSPSAGKEQHRQITRRWRAFTAENGARTGYFIPFFQILLWFGGRKWPRWPLYARISEANWLENWQAFSRALASVDARSAQQMEEGLWAPFKRLDHLAEIYGRAYRGTYVLIYLLASLATFFGLSGAIFHDFKPLGVLIEFILIIIMIIVTFVGRCRRWHERWLEYRAIAEQLRRARNGIWSGRALEPSAPEGDGNLASAAWANWYVRACVRALPLVNAAATAAYVHLALQTIDELEVREQQAFNTRNAHVQQHIHHRLEGVEVFCLVLLFLCCFGFLTIYWFDVAQFRTHSGLHEAKPTALLNLYLPDIMTFVGGLIPAVGAALLGVRSQADFGAYASHSADTAAQLQAISAGVAQWRAPLADEPDFEVLLDLTDRTTEALAGDVFAWRMVYRRKVLTVST